MLWRALLLILLAVAEGLAVDVYAPLAKDLRQDLVLLFQMRILLSAFLNLSRRFCYRAL